jgi:hypothetical protein
MIVADLLPLDLAQYPNKRTSSSFDDDYYCWFQVDTLSNQLLLIAIGTDSNAFAISCH